MGTGEDFPSEYMSIVVVLTYVGDRRLPDDGRVYCQTGGS